MCSVAVCSAQVFVQSLSRAGIVDFGHPLVNLEVLANEIFVLSALRIGGRFWDRLLLI